MQPREDGRLDVRRARDGRDLRGRRRGGTCCCPSSKPAKPQPEGPSSPEAPATGMPRFKVHRSRAWPLRPRDRRRVRLARGSSTAVPKLGGGGAVPEGRLLGSVFACRVSFRGRAALGVLHTTGPGTARRSGARGRSQAGAGSPAGGATHRHPLGGPSRKTTAAGGPSTDGLTGRQPGEAGEAVRTLFKRGGRASAAGNRRTFDNFKQLNDKQRARDRRPARCGCSPAVAEDDDSLPRRLESRAGGAARSFRDRARSPRTLRRRLPILARVRERLARRHPGATTAASRQLGSRNHRGGTLEELMRSPTGGSTPPKQGCGPRRATSATRKTWPKVLRAGPPNRSRWPTEGRVLRGHRCHRGKPHDGGQTAPQRGRESAELLSGPFGGAASRAARRYRAGG